jgi:hypothetical protein
VNISARLRVETGDGVMIGGFIVRGDEAKRLLLRGVGPSLATAGIQDFVPNPMLRLFGADGSQIAENDNWADSQGADIQASGLAPNHPLEAAMIAKPEPWHLHRLGCR